MELISFFERLKGDRYKYLRLKLFFIIGLIASIPLFLIVSIAYIWLYGIAKEDIAIRFTEKIETTSITTEYYIKEKLSGLKFLASFYSYEYLAEQKNINHLFQRFKQEFGELVDLGIIGDDGIQRVYAGPYKLLGKDYSNHHWFESTILKGFFVSDVFTGYRKVPHFAITVKKDISAKGTFCILRATIDIDRLIKRIELMNLSPKEDAFFINDKKVLQTDSRFYGKALQEVSGNLLSGVNLHPTNLTIKELDSKRGFIGLKRLNNPPWYLIMTTSDTPHDKIMELIKRNSIIVYFAILVVITCTFVNYKITNSMVNWLESSEKSREEAIAQSEHSNRLASIGRLAAGVAHEINNPLAIINEKAGLMKDILELSRDFPHKDKFLSTVNAITDSVNRCKNITHRLLGFARQMNTQLEMLNIDSLIKEVIMFLEKDMLYRDIKLKLNLNEGLPMIESDRGQLQQVFLNIINNAIDAITDNGIIEISANKEKNDLISVSIKDNGSGIPPDKIKKVFEPFYTTKEKGKGTGLGLSITYGIVKKLGGDIVVTSKVHEGTTFTVFLPIKTENK